MRWGRSVFSLSARTLTSVTEYFTFVDRSKTDGCLGKRMGEHASKWLVKQTTYPLPEQKVSTRNPASSIVKHLITFGHQMDSGRAFQAILRNCNPRLFAFCEALSINRLRPPLCGQKLSTHNVSLSRRQPIDFH